MNNALYEVIDRQRRSAVFPIVCADHCAWLQGKSLAAVAADGELLADTIAHAYRLYRYDMALVFIDPYVEAQALGCGVTFDPHLKLLGPARPVLEAIALTPPEIDDCPPHPSCGIDRTPVILTAVQILKKKLAVPIFASIKGPFSLAGFLTSTERFLKLLLRDEDRARKVLSTALEFQLKYVTALTARSVDVFIGDPLASGSIISRPIFEKFAREPLQMLIDRVHENNRRCGIHICGDTRLLVPSLDGLGADMLSIEDITPETKTLKMGGVATATILGGERVALQREIEDALRADRLILATACDVPVQTDPDRIRSMIRIYRRLTA